MSSIPEALPTPRHQIRRAETQLRPIVDTDVVIELVVAIIVGWLVLALVGSLAGRVAPGHVPVNATYSRPQ